MIYRPTSMKRNITKGKGKQKELQVTLVPLYQIPPNVLQQYQQLQETHAKLWKFVNFSWPDPDMALVRQFVEASRYEELDEVVINGTTVSLSPTTISEVLKIPLGRVN